MIAVTVLMLLLPLTEAYFTQKPSSGGTLNIAASNETRRNIKAFFFNITGSPLSGFRVIGNCAHKEKTDTVAAAHNCTLAMNGGPFKYPQKEGPFCKGHMVSNGKILSDFPTQRVDFGVTKGGEFGFGSVTTEQVGDFQQLLTGFELLLLNGVPQPLNSSQSDTLLAPRTAIGLDETGNLLMMQAEGIEKMHVGLNLTDWTLWLAEMGFYNAVNLDGGGSSATWYDGKVLGCPTCIDLPLCCVRKVVNIVCIP
jgi:exopolysaccharide biosynthesis protein